MANLILLKNPLTPNEREVFPLEDGKQVIDWLQEHHPDGFGMPIRFYVNGEEKELDDLDYLPEENDVIIIALMPGGFLAAMPLLVKVVIGLAVMAAAYFAMMLFAPKVPKNKKNEEKETYSIDSDQNAARYGEPIPVVYGDVWQAPDYVAQPRTWFYWSTTLGYDEIMSGIQYLDLLLCVGQGSVEVTNVKVGSSDANVLGSDVVAWRSFQPWEHNSKMGVISANMGELFFENVITCTEIDNQEFIERGNASKYYAISNTSFTGSIIEIDVIYPNGLFEADKDGNLFSRDCSFDVFYREIDANNNPIGPEYRHNVYHDVGPGGGSGIKNKAEFSNPVRRTTRIYTGRSARWAVKIVRLSGAVSSKKGNSTFVWSGLKLIADDGRKAYGNVTLLAVRIKASRGVGGEGAVRVQARCKRWMPTLPDGAYVHSTSPADAFYDIYTNTQYGAGRSPSELELDKIRALKVKWAGYQFNHVFKERSTVWEALKTAVVGQAAEPLPLGSVMSIAQDGVKPTRSMLFTDANIVEGSMKVNYIFDVEEDSDGIEVQYTDPFDWKEQFVRWPTTSVIPETVTLAGCTSAQHAAEYARLNWQRTRLQRKRISFDTELEGIILQMGDRIAVSHEMPRWGDSGLVLGVSGLQVTVDKSLDWSGGAKFMMFRKADGSPSELYSVTQGGQPNIAVLATALTFAPHVDDAYDYTAYTFGTATTVVQDFMVASTKHSSDTIVSIEAVNYSPQIFDGAMSFLR